MVFIAMEYLQHGDLQKYLNRSFPEAQVKDIASQLVEGLGYMHDNGFTHRDLKPAVGDFDTWHVATCFFSPSQLMQRLTIRLEYPRLSARSWLVG